MDTLPIEHVRDAFVEALQGARPVVVSAPTGSGKSTRLPAWLLKWTAGRVWVVEPRRVACRALAQWVAVGQGEEVGHTVGYRVRFEDRTSASTRVTFVTPGVALNLWSKRAILPADVVVVDEFHERGWEVDLFSALVLEARRGMGAGPKLVVCSATLDLESLRERLGAVVIESAGRTFEVEIEYRGDSMPSPEELDARVAQAVAEAGGAGDILVFLPGKGEIERCARALASRGEKRDVVAVHGGLEPRALTRAFEPGGSPKIYLATNVAETSLTLPGVDQVIDSGLVRMRMHRGGRSVLALGPIAASSMAQRAGRAGRVRPGRCLRLWSSRFIAEPTTPPEVDRVELDDLVLRAAMCGVHGDRLQALPWVTAPPAFALTSACERLRARGTLDEQGAPTESGLVQARLPISGFGARILAGCPQQLAPMLADLVAVIEGGRSLMSDRPCPDRAELLQGAVDEVRAELRCLRFGDPRRHGLRGVALAEARRLARSLGGLGRTAQRIDQEHWRAATEYLLRVVPEAVFVARERRSPPRGRMPHGPAARPWGNGEIELWIRDYAVLGAEPDQQPKPAVAGLILDQQWLGAGKSARGVGRMLLRCELSCVERAGLYEEVSRQPSLAKRQITATVERRYAGVILSSECRAVTGSALWSAAAALIVVGRLRKGWVDRILDGLHRWRLGSRWATAHRAESSAGPISAPPDDPREHVAARLEALGVERTADLDLLEVADIVPGAAELGAMTGVSERELDKLVEDFPRQWAFKGGRCDLDVDFGRRRVTLTPDKMDLKGDPPTRYLPRFRGFSVDYVRASRRQRLR